MRTAILFELPEEAEAHRDALDGSSWRAAAWEFDQFLRNEVKHGKNKSMTCAEIRKEFNDHLADHGVSFDD